MAEASESTLSVDVWRGAAEGRFQTFAVPRRAHQTILDVVTEIQRDQDATLSYRFACRVGMCGSCAMVVNGRPRWTCRTRVSEAVTDDGKLKLEPLRNFTVVKDLAVEMVAFFDKWRDAKGHFEPGEAQGGFPGGAAGDARAQGRRRRHRMHRLRRLPFGLRRGDLEQGLSRSGAAQPRLDPGQRRARRRQRCPHRCGVRQRRLPRLPQPHELHGILPARHFADLFDRRARSAR